MLQMLSKKLGKSPLSELMEVVAVALENHYRQKLGNTLVMETIYRGAPMLTVMKAFDLVRQQVDSLPDLPEEIVKNETLFLEAVKRVIGMEHKEPKRIQKPEDDKADRQEKPKRPGASKPFR